MVSVSIGSKPSHTHPLFFLRAKVYPTTSSSLCPAPGTRPRSESKTFDDDWLKTDVTVHLLTLFGWTVPSGVAIKSYGDTSLLGEA